MTNIQTSQLIIQRCLYWGVDTFCLCPGGRNAPFIELLSRSETLDCPSFYDERSAGFFALGRARRDQRPVAIVTTSGTAVSELLSSVIEAYYSGVSLVIISADRPKDFRGTGAPQTIDQVNIYGGYTQATIDIEGCLPDFWPNLANGSLHINVCFSEPLVDGPLSKKISWSLLELEAVAEGEIKKDRNSKGPSSLVQQNEENFSCSTGRSGRPMGFINQAGTEALKKEEDLDFSHRVLSWKRPLVIVSSLSDFYFEYNFNQHEAGGLDLENRKGIENAVVEIVEKYQCPLFVESTSGLRGHPRLSQYQITSERVVNLGIENKMFDGILKIGGTPLAKFWRHIEKSDIPILSIDNKPFGGGIRVDHHQIAWQKWADVLPRNLCHIDVSTFQEWQKMWGDQFIQLCEKFPNSEPSLVRKISKDLLKSDEIYIGNSLPIRWWDLVSIHQNCARVLASRGANGIDGQLSCALGQIRKGKPLTILLGDLTTLYDLSGLSLLPYLTKENLRCRIVVLNNKGGMIFSRLFGNPAFFNTHNVNFENLAKGFGWSYRAFLGESAFGSKGEVNEVIECLPVEAETAEFWKQCDKFKFQ